MRNWRKTSWAGESGKNKIEIASLLDLLEHELVVKVPLKDISHIRDLSYCSDRVKEANLSYPIIIIEKFGAYHSILDGHHRRRKAMNQKKTYICAKILRISCIPVQFSWLCD